MNETSQSSAKVLVASCAGFIIGFFIVYYMFQYEHRAGFVFPIVIGIWITVLVNSFTIRGKIL